MEKGRGGANGRLGLVGQLFSRFAAKDSGGVGPTIDPLADATHLVLRQHGIAPTPEAYTLWYRHLAGQRPDLTRRLKELEASGATFDSALIAELFERYFATDPEVTGVCEASRNLERLLAALAIDLKLVETDARQRGDRLADLGQSLAEGEAATNDGSEAAAHPALWRKIVGDIIKETAAMRAAASRLESRVVEHAGEIAQLRAQLDAAGRNNQLDPVSGVASSKSLEQALAEAMRSVDRAIARANGAAATDGAPSSPGPGLSFLLVDLDQFHAFNAANGRKLGDLVLKATARNLAMAIKGADTIGRLDGASFGIVLTRTELKGAEALAERLCTLIASLRIEVADHERAADPRLAPVTVSIGVSTYRPGEPPKRLIGRASRACEHATETGGNRAVSERAIAVVGRPKA